MGRPLKLEGAGNIVGFKASNLLTVEMIKIISRREGVTVQAIYNRAIDEYVEKHGKGNFQTLMGSFTEGGLRSDAQVEADIISKLTKENPRKEIQFKYLLEVCRDFGFSKDAAEHANNISKLLIREGWKVWR